MWFAKLEDHRYYTHKDKEVQQGLRKRGEKKEDDQRYIQILVRRKDITGRYMLSPMNSSKGRNAEHSKKMGQFDRVAFKQSGESLFDREFDFDRGLKHTLAHANILKDGSLAQREQLDLLMEAERDIGRDGSFINELATEISRESYTSSIDLVEQITHGLGGLLGTLLEPVPPGVAIVPEQEPRKKKKKKGYRVGR